MNRVSLVTCLLILSYGLQGQRGSFEVFSAPIVDNPIIHADGIHSFIAESDRHIRLGEMEEAVLVLDAAIGQNPNIAEVFVKRAQILMKLGRLSEAKRDLRKANNLNPLLTTFFQSRGQLEKLSLLEFSETRYREVVAKKYPEELAAIFQQGLDDKVNGDIMASTLKFKSIEASLEEDDAVLTALLANNYLLIEDYTRAINYYNKAIRINPDNAYYYFNRAVAKIFLNQRSAACDDLERSQEMGYKPSNEKLKYFCYY